MTTDLTTLALHESYIAFDRVLIGDVIGLSIANTGSFTLNSLPTLLLFTNVLHVFAMYKNLIPVSTFVSLTLLISFFFYSFFQVQDRHMRVTLVRGQHRDDVYYWMKSVPFRSSALALSSSIRSSVSTISMWHSHLGHSCLHIFRKFPSVLNISFPHDRLCSFSCTSCNINKIHK